MRPRVRPGSGPSDRPMAQPGAGTGPQGAISIVRGAEAIVMGAFGHSRLREAVLGGATRDLLSAPPMPLVLAR